MSLYFYGKGSKVLVAIGGGAGAKEILEFAICDDCRHAYPAPPYYTFDQADCKENVAQDIFTTPHENCTGNLCPSCGDLLEPDNPTDPRKSDIYWVNGQWYSKGVR